MWVQMRLNVSRNIASFNIALYLYYKSNQLYKHIFFHTVELKKLQSEGFGVYVDRSRMEIDKILPNKQCFAAFVKRDILDLPEKFFEMATATECTKEMYVTNYDKPMDMNLKKVAAIYHRDKHRLNISLESNMSESKYNFFK